MQTIDIKTPPAGTEQSHGSLGRDLLPLLAGTGVAVGGVGAFLALSGLDSPLRGPFALFFLLAAPGAAIGAALHGLQPWGRLVASAAGAIALDMLVAQAMLAVHRWSVDGGIAAVTVLSALILLLVQVRRLRGRTARRRTS
ncbi:hypothetical protein ACWCP6_12110 [Streptomyces sp. NPDC002004]